MLLKSTFYDMLLKSYGHWAVIPILNFEHNFCMTGNWVWWYKKSTRFWYYTLMSTV